jgi:O-antigen ligase
MVIVTTHPHNAYLEALLDLGIAGLALVLAYYFHLWRGFRRLGWDPGLTPALRGFFQGAAAALAAYLIAAVSDESLTPKAEQTFLWLAIGMMYGQLALTKEGADDRR